MLRSTLLLILLGSFCCPVMAELLTQVDKANIAVDESLTLTISSSDHLRLSPDLDPLNHDFYIVGTSRHSQIHFLNGSAQTEAQWQIVLLPKHSGELQIPALQVGKEATEPQLIHVVPVAKDTSVSKSNVGDDIFIDVAVTPKESFVQEQFIYTLKVYFARTIENGYIEPPSMSDATIAQNGQDIMYTTTHKGKYYHVLERSYLVTPQKVGHFSIEPPFVKGYVPNSKGMVDLYGFTNQAVKSIKVSATPIEVTIKPKPVHFAGHWFPAKKVTLNDTWEPQPLVFREGEPVTRTIEVSAEGATGEQIPSLQLPQTANVNIYPQQGERGTTANAGVSYGKLQQKITYIPTQSGRLTLPPVKVHWWNTKTRQDAYATLPSQTITVLPAVLANIQMSQPKSPPHIKAQPTVKQSDNQKSVQKQTSYFWPALACLSLIMWLVTLFLWRKQSKSEQQSFNKQKPLTAKDYYQGLQAACLANNPAQTRELFLKWVRLYWKEPSIHSLADIVTKLNAESATLTSEIMRLEAAFYSDHQDHWQGHSFWSALEQWTNKGHAKNSNSPDDPLPPLYCST